MLLNHPSCCFSSADRLQGEQGEQRGGPAEGGRGCSRSVAQVRAAAFVGEGEVESQGVLLPRDAAQRRQDAALLVQHHPEVP